METLVSAWRRLFSPGIRYERFDEYGRLVVVVVVDDDDDRIFGGRLCSVQIRSVDQKPVINFAYGKLALRSTLNMPITRTPT